MKTPAKFLSLTPILNVTNFRASMAYYTRKLGFNKIWEYGKPPRFGCVSRDGFEIFLSHNTRGRRGGSLYFTVADVDALHRQLRKRGAKVTHRPEDKPWEMREFDVRDPDANTLFFGQYRPPKDLKIERTTVQARLEKRLAAVVKDLARETNRTLGELLEETLLHCFVPVPGREGQAVASPHIKQTLQLIERLKKKHALDYDTHASYRFKEA